MIWQLLDGAVRFVEEVAEGVTAACSGWWMLRDFHSIYAVETDGEHVG